MRLRAAIFLILGGLGTWGILHAQKPFLSYESTEEHAEAPLPPDWERQAEWTRGRLKYTSSTFEHPFPTTPADTAGAPITRWGIATLCRAC